MKKVVWYLLIFIVSLRQMLVPFIRSVLETRSYGTSQHSLFLVATFYTNSILLKQVF